jgi:hypothetical protein
MRYRFGFDAMNLFSHPFALDGKLGHRSTMQDQFLSMEVVLGKEEWIFDQEDHFGHADCWVLFPKLMWVYDRSRLDCHSSPMLSK